MILGMKFSHGFAGTACWLMTSAMEQQLSAFFLRRGVVLKQSITFYRNQLIFCLAAVPLGAVVGAICAFFGSVLLKITAFRNSHSFALLPFLGVAGVVIVWCYQKFGKESNKGMSLLFEVHQEQRASIPLRLVPMSMGSTWMTHLFGGSAGREGVAVQIGGTLGNFIGNKIKVSDGNKILMIAGMAAGFGGLFRIPLTAVFFSLEVLRRGAIEYAALLPSVVAAFTADYVSGLLEGEKFTHFIGGQMTLNFGVVVKLIVMGVAFGLIGMLFSILLKKLKVALSGWMQNSILRILACGTAIAVLSIACFQGRYSGFGTNLVEGAFSGDIMPWDFALKILFTTLTLAAGYCGGEVIPLCSIGASAGFVLAGVLGLPVELCVALGYVSVLGSATNTFFAPVFMGIEVFGTRYIPWFAVVCAIAYICNGRKSVYSLQK